MNARAPTADGGYTGGYRCYNKLCPAKGKLEHNADTEHGDICMKLEAGFGNS